MERIYLDRDWKFAEEYCDEMAEIAYDESAMEDVLIPHNVKNMPLHYFDESIYQMVSGYRRHIKIEKEWKGKSAMTANISPIFRLLQIHMRPPVNYVKFLRKPSTIPISWQYLLPQGLTVFRKMSWICFLN